MTIRWVILDAGILDLVPFAFVDGVASSLSGLSRIVGATVQPSFAVTTQTQFRRFRRTEHHSTSVESSRHRSFHAFTLHSGATVLEVLV